MNCLIVGIICLIVGWLDPIVLWRKATGLAEKDFFPKAEAWRNKWRSAPSEPSQSAPDVQEHEKTE